MKILRHSNRRGMNEHVNDLVGEEWGFRSSTFPPSFLTQYIFSRDLRARGQVDGLALGITSLQGICLPSFLTSLLLRLLRGFRTLPSPASVGGD